MFIKSLTPKLHHTNYQNVASKLQIYYVVVDNVLVCYNQGVHGYKNEGGPMLKTADVSERMSIILVWRFRKVYQTGEPTGVPQRTFRRALRLHSHLLSVFFLHQIYVGLPFFSTAYKIVAQTC